MALANWYGRGLSFFKISPPVFFVNLFNFSQDKSYIRLMNIYS